MEIGRLEFYATKRDIRGSFFGKIRPYNKSLRNGIDDGLVFFHESCIPSTSALRTDRRLQGYRSKYRQRGRTVYANPVYVAFDVSRDLTTQKGGAATTVMLLEEASPDGLPNLASVDGAGARVALISAFPSVYTLSRIGVDLVESDHVTEFKTCWDGSGDDERIAFVRSLDTAHLERTLIQLVGIDKMESRSLASPRRTRLTLSTRPEIALIPEVAAQLTPSMWVDEFLAIIGEPEKRKALMSSTQPPFRAYALTKFLEGGGELQGDLATDFIAAVRGSAGAGIATEYMRNVLAAQPRLSLRDDISDMLTPELWVDGFLGLMRNPAERSTLLAHARPEFRADSLARLTESGVSLDGEMTHVFVTAIHECVDGEFAAKCMRRVLSIQPQIALVGSVSFILTPEMWVDGLLNLMVDQSDLKTLLAHARPEFRTYATARYVEAGARLREADIPGFAGAVSECGDATMASECLVAVLAKQPQIALNGAIASILTPDLWVDEVLGLITNPEAQMSLLAQSQPAFRVHAVRKLIEAGVDLDIGVLGLCPLRSCPALLHQVRWSVDDASYAKAVGSWLQEAYLCDGEGRRLVVTVAERMHSTNDLLSPTMWAHLPAVVKVRLCIAWSNHYANLDHYVMRGGIRRACIDAYKESWRGYDPASKAALLLLALPLSKNPEKVFLDANDALIGEIVRQFNVCDANALWSFALSDELQALLQRCASRQYVDNQSVRGFCDGRWWEGASSVWCHAGVDRPCDGRRKCEWLHFPNDAASIDDANLPDQENQFMATLLANANNAMGRGVNVGPWLDSRDSMSLVDYAYRVSGYVNKMATALPHMVCRGCGARLRLNYEYPRNSLYARSLNLPALPASVCSCPNAGDGHIHDEGVYIHYCLNCHRIIDSRECRLKDRGSDGYYLCMYCGASKLHRPATVCPSCGNTDLGALGYYRGSMRTEMSCLREGEPSGEVLVVCKARGCKYDARDFASEFEQRSSG